jgi:hypothetical protein
MKIKLLSKTMILLVLSFGWLNLIHNQAGAAPDSVLYFTPESQSVKVNSNPQLTAMINPNSNQVTAVELHISFDQTKLRLDGISTVGSAFSVILQTAQIDNENGKASIIMGVSASSPIQPVANVSKVADFNFQALSTSVNTAVLITSNSLVASVGEAGNTLLERKPANIKIESDNINQLPIGTLDYADSKEVVGWAYDADAGTDPILVHIYVNGVFRASEQASVYRADLVNILGSGNHGYNYTYSEPLFEGTYKIEVFGINQPVGDNPKIGEKIIVVEPVCGDGVCNGNESYSTCPSDCPPPPDTTAPVITNLAVSEITYNSVVISWDTNEPATSQVQYGSTNQYGQEAQIPGIGLVEKHSVKLTGLSSDSTYHYRAKSMDAAGNTGYSIDRTFTTTGVPDTTPPAAIGDLRYANTTQTSVDLHWTAPGNDGNVGVAKYYDIRYSSSPITESNWANAKKLSGAPVPGTAGTAEFYAAVGFTHSTTYYFAIKTGDQAGNISSLSNVISATTQTPTLSVSLAATDEFGYAPLNNVDLSATVSGTAGGNISYVFYCNRSDSGTNITTPYNAKFDNITATTKTADNLCNYDLPGEYTAKVIVTRSGLAAENRAIIRVETAPDLTAPEISEVVALNITHNSVSISWMTDEPATGSVEYGINPLILNQASGIVSGLSSTHNINLTNLLPGTLYSYRVKSGDAIGNLAVSEIYSFTTMPAPDTISPAAVTDLLASDPFESSLKLSWTSPGNDGNVGIASHYDIRYSTLAINNSNWSGAIKLLAAPTPATAGTPQEMMVGGLLAGTNYYFALKTIDQAGNVSDLSNIAEATTKQGVYIDTIPPVISNINTNTSILQTAIITWETDELAETKLVWGERRNNLQQVVYDFYFASNHELVLENLKENTAYYFKIIAKDQSGNESQSDILSFKTERRAKNPKPVTNLKASNGSIKLSWRNPNYEFAEKIVIARSAVKYPSKNDKDSVIAEIKDMKQKTYKDENVTTGITYYYSVFVVDDLGVYSDPANVSFQRLERKTDIRQVSGGGYSDDPAQGKVRNAEIFQFDGGVLLKWENPTDSNYVRTIIARKAGEAPDSVKDGVIVYEGSGKEFTDSGLENGQTYGYGIFTYDRMPNFSEAVKLKAIIQNQNQYIQNSANNTDFPTFGLISDLSKVQGEMADQISLGEGGRVAAHASFVNMTKSSAGFYDKTVSQIKAKISQKQKYSLAYFIQNGTYTTEKLGSGERAGVVTSYERAFGKMPLTEKDWQDVIKIANGRWPGQKSLQAETAAKQDFKVVYKREAKDTPADNAAIAIMAYGLRPAERSVRSERAATTTFKSIYRRSPSSAADWDKVRAIAYSGAQR